MQIIPNGTCPTIIHVQVQLSLPCRQQRHPYLYNSYFFMQIHWTPPTQEWVTQYRLVLTFQGKLSSQNLSGVGVVLTWHRCRSDLSSFITGASADFWSTIREFNSFTCKTNTHTTLRRKRIMNEGNAILKLTHFLQCCKDMLNKLLW